MANILSHSHISLLTKKKNDNKSLHTSLYTTSERDGHTHMYPNMQTNTKPSSSLKSGMIFVSILSAVTPCSLLQTLFDSHQAKTTTVVM